MDFICIRQQITEPLRYGGGSASMNRSAINKHRGLDKLVHLIRHNVKP